MTRSSSTRRNLAAALPLTVSLLLIGSVRVVHAVGYGFNAVTFAVISDAHIAIGDEDGRVLAGSSVRILEGVVAELNRNRDLDFTLVTGDLLNDGEVWAAEKAREVLDRLRAPYFVIPGNHDYTSVPPEENSKDKVHPFQPGLSRADFMRIFAGRGFAGTPLDGPRSVSGPNGCWSIDPVPGLHLVGLDTTGIGAIGGHITGPELRWLEADLTFHRDKATFVAAHHTLVPFDSKDAEYGHYYYVDNADAVKAVLERHRQVQAVITGHHHMSGAKTVNGVHHFTCPSLVAWPCEYTLFQLTADSVTMRCVPIPETGLIATARENLLRSGFRMSLYPKGKSGDEEILRSARQVTELTLPLRAW